MSTFYGVGLGPGDPGLVTLKAVNTIKECRAIVVPAGDLSRCRAYSIARQAVPEIDEKEIYPFAFPMTSDEDRLRPVHDEVADRVRALLDEGKDVAFLTIGDVALYSTFAYIQRRLSQTGHETLMISGVPSFCAVAAKHNIPIAEGAGEVHIIPGGSDPELSKDYGGTRVYMKSGKALRGLIAFLKAQMREEPLEIYAVANCGFEDEVVYRNLEELENENNDRYLTTVIVKRSV